MGQPLGIVVGGDAARQHVGDIGAGRKGPPRAGEDDAAHRIVPGGLRQPAGELRQKLARQGVDLVGAIEGQHHDALNRALFEDEPILVGHCLALLASVHSRPWGTHGVRAPSAMCTDLSSVYSSTP